MNLNDFFSKPTRVKEAYANNYPSYPAADAADASSDSNSEPKFDRLAKTGKEPEFDFRTGLDVGDDETDYETENEPELGTFRMGKPVEPDDADTNAFVAALTPGQQDNRFTAPAGWRYVEKDEDPARYGSDTTVSGAGTPNWRSIAGGKLAADWGSIPPALDTTPKSKYRFDRNTQSQVPIAGSGANPNIDDDTRARARAWAAQKNAPGAALAGAMRSSGDPVDTKIAPAAPAVAKPVVEPVAVKPVVVPPAAAATTLKDLPSEKPMSWKDIAQANGIDNPNRIMPGQVLKIPGRADYTVKPGDTLADIAAGKTKAPKYTPTTPSAGDTQPAAAAVLKKHPNIGTLAPIPRDVMKDLGMDAQTKKEIAKYGREELLTPAIIKKQNYDPTPAEALAALRANEKAMAAKIAARDAEREANRKKVKEANIDEQTMDDGFKWGSPTMPMQDGSVHKYNPQTNSYSQVSPPTKPDLNTSMSTITRDRTTDKNGQSNQNYSDVSIAMNPATGTGDYMHRQDVNGVPTTTFRKDVPADELAKLRTGAGMAPAQPAVKENLDRMRFLAGIHKK